MRSNHGCRSPDVSRAARVARSCGQRLSLAGVLLTSLACALASGCQAAPIPLPKVSGRVTFNGLPARAELVFQPQGANNTTGGRPSLATTRPDGTFELLYTATDSGAIVGSHRVTVTVLVPETSAGLKKLPEKFYPAKIAHFQRDVVDGRRNVFPFVLGY